MPAFTYGNENQHIVFASNKEEAIKILIALNRELRDIVHQIEYEAEAAKLGRY